MPGNSRAAPISIIVPVLDEAAMVPGMLAALRDFRARGCEVLVVDGGSRDATAELTRGSADRVLVATRGRASQMNAGTAAAQGDILLFLHADTRLPEKADALIRAGLAASGRAWGRFDVRIEGRHPLLRVVAGMMNLRSRWSGIATGDQALFMTRAAFDAVGGFPPIELMEDIAVSGRLNRISPPLCLYDRVTTSGRRWEKNGVLRTVVLMWWLRLQYFFGVSPGRLARAYRSGKIASRILVFARAPVAGEVKTRLIPALGAEGAMRLYGAMARQCIATAVQALSGAVQLWCAPGVTHAFFAQAQAEWGVSLHAQADGDIGLRMSAALRAALGEADAVLLIGSDVPSITVDDITAALAALAAGRDAVFVPTLDGGYALIGLRRHDPRLFESIAWSTPQVMAQTRERLCELAWDWLELPVRWDVDEEADLAQLAADPKLAHLLEQGG